jgi:hypothetical protein
MTGMSTNRAVNVTKGKQGFQPTEHTEPELEPLEPVAPEPVSDTALRVEHALIASEHDTVEDWARDSGFAEISEQWPQRASEFDWEDEDGVGIDDLDERFLEAMAAAEANTDWGSTGVHAGSYTHWGKAQQAADIAPGITQVSTAGHGGLKLSDERNALVPEAVRYPNGWYEEDIAWTAVAIAHPEAFDPETVAAAHRDAKGSYPDGYEEATGVKIAPGESYARDIQVFNDAHAESVLTTSAIGYTDAEGNDMVRVTGRVGGRSNHGRPETEATYSVPAAEYRTRDQNPGGTFVVDPAKHPVMSDHDVAVSEAVDLVQRHTRGVEIHQAAGDAKRERQARRDLEDAQKALDGLTEPAA